MRDGFYSRFIISLICGFNVGMVIDALRNDGRWVPFAISAALLVVAWGVSFWESERSDRQRLSDIRRAFLEDRP